MPGPDYYDGVGPRRGWYSTWESFATVIGGGAQNGFGLGDAGSGMAGNAGIAQVGRDMGRRVAERATDAVLGQYAGYGELWTYDAAAGVAVTPLGWAVGAAVGVALWMVLK